MDAGRWRFHFEVSADAAEPDDDIEIVGSIGKTSWYALSFQCIFGAGCGWVCVGGGGLTRFSVVNCGDEKTMRRCSTISGIISRNKHTVHG
jgi:hypothetical protein